ncbi:MAG TPA: hypothetical protein VEU62_05555, partial [Bryobacterales bacterium]|nr:hypothetical protein [Bryobacterales bacterium]
MDACPVLILDTDWASDHTRIDGIPVRYAGRNLAGILRQYKVEILMLSGADSLAAREQEVVAACVREGLAVARFEMAVRPLRPGDRAAAAAPLPAVAPGAFHP